MLVREIKIGQSKGEVQLTEIGGYWNLKVKVGTFSVESEALLEKELDRETERVCKALGILLGIFP